MKSIEVKNLNKTYKQKLKKIRALNGMDFEVDEGQICGFLGPNGAGKSTTLKIIMDFIRADSGDVFINGLSSKEISSRKGVGFMPENPPYMDFLSGKDLLMLSAKMHCIDSKIANSRSEELLNMLDLSESSDKKIRNYSKGMIQRIGFASTLIIDPKLLILDEPMSGLDPVGRYKFKNILRDMHARGTTIFFSSHIIPDIEDICDRVIIVDKGRVIKVLDEKQMKVFSNEGYRITLSKNAIVDNFKVKKSTSGLNLIEIKKDKLDEVIVKLKKQNINILSIEPLKRNLEEIFVKLISDDM